MNAASVLPTPQLCTGVVRHRRLHPAGNAFQYGVYFLRLPMRQLARAATPIKGFGLNRFNLLAFYDADHGHGKAEAGAALGWLEQLLQDEGVTGVDGEIWLHTFPRMLGYVFKPVSFWFCENQAGEVRAIVCEVNNTFGERHAYLLCHDDASALPWGEALRASKQMHVSPFCSLRGHYQFRFMQALRPVAETNALHTVARIDYWESLAPGAAPSPLLQTSMQGVAQPLTTTRLVRAFFSYPLMTVGVIVRIHWQALKLWWKGVPFFKKPAAPSTEVSR